MKHAPRFEWTFSGFIIGMLLASMLVTSLTIFAYDLQDGAGISGNIGLNAFNKSADLINLTGQIKDSTEDISQPTGGFDLVGGYFGAAIGAFKLAATSMNVFFEMADGAANEIEFFGMFKDIMVAIVIVALIIGVVLAAYLKWRT